MKLLFALILTPSLCFAAANAEFTKGIDFTGQTSFTASQLNNLVDNAKPAARRGLVISTNATPDTTTFPYFTNYLWRDISTTPPTLKFWSGTAWASAAVASGSITTDALVDSSVTTAKLTNGAVTVDKLGPNAVERTKIADLAINEAKLDALAVTRAKIALGAVDGTILTNNTITAAHLQANSVAASNIIAGSITSNQIANKTIVASNLVDAVITSDKIAGGAVVQTNLGANCVVSSNITDGVISTNKFDNTVLYPRAWVHYDSIAGSVTLNRQFNVSGITRIGAGIYSLTFSNAFPTTNYMINMTVGAPGFKSDAYPYSVSYATNTVNGFTFRTGFYTDTPIDTQGTIIVY